MCFFNTRNSSNNLTENYPKHVVLNALKRNLPKLLKQNKPANEGHTGCKGGGSNLYAAPTNIHVYPNPTDPYHLNIEWKPPVGKNLTLTNKFITVNPVDSITTKIDNGGIAKVPAYLNETSTGSLSYRV